MFRNSIHDWMKFHYLCQRFRWCNGKSVQIEDTWVLSTQNRIGIVRHGDSSEEIDAQLSKIEDNGKEEFRPETSIFNFDARQEKIETGVVVKNRKGLSGVEGGQGICHQWKEKGQCSKGDQCSFRHESNNRAQKPEPKAPHFPSPRCHEVEVCRRKEIIMVPFFDNRADTIWKVLARDRFVNVGIHPSVNFIKQKRAVKPGISAFSRIVRLMNNQTKSQRKATITQKEEKATTRMLWLLWKLYHFWVASRKTRKH